MWTSNLVVFPVIWKCQVLSFYFNQREKQGFSALRWLMSTLTPMRQEILYHFNHLAQYSFTIKRLRVRSKGCPVGGAAILPLTIASFCYYIIMVCNGTDIGGVKRSLFSLKLCFPFKLAAVCCKQNPFFSKCWEM